MSTPTVPLPAQEPAIEQLLARIAGACEEGSDRYGRALALARRALNAAPDGRIDPDALAGLRKDIANLIVALLAHNGHQAEMVGAANRVSVLARAIPQALTVEPDPAPEAAPHRHRRPRTAKPRGHLRPVDGAKKAAPALIPAAVLGARAGHRALGIKVGIAAAAVPLAAAGIRMANTPDITRAPAVHQAAALHVPGPDTSAVPWPSPTTAAQAAKRAEPYRGKHRAPVPAVSASPEPSPSASPSPAPSPGHLAVAEQELAIGGSGMALLDVSAQGGAVLWQASGTGGVQVDRASGGLAAGGHDQLVVSVPVALMIRPGTGSVIITTAAGVVTVAVSWN